MTAIRPELRYMTVGDVDRVYEIETHAHSAPWSKLTFQRELIDGRHNTCMVAEIDERIVGFVCLYYVMDEGHVTNIAVDNFFQNHGIATFMMLAVIDVMISKGVKRLTLEVRKTNEKAQRLYSKFGFKMKGLRKRYYTDNNEDAYIFWTDDITGEDYQSMVQGVREEFRKQ
jgi:ribosomal-protein-alanine N-acetyltransferase